MSKRFWPHAAWVVSAGLATAFLAPSGPASGATAAPPGAVVADSAPGLLAALGGTVTTEPVAAGSVAATAVTAAKLKARLSVRSMTLTVPLPYRTPGYNNLAEWARIDTQAAPNGTVKVAWPTQGGIRVTPLTKSLDRAAADVVVPKAKEVGGLVAHNAGFAVLTRLPDTNKWDETAAHLLKYNGRTKAFDVALTGTASNDTSPVLDGQLRWNGTKYGAYFVVHGAGGFADGHFGDKLAYRTSTGAKAAGGWDWGCSHNQGTALLPRSTGVFWSVCGEDWRSGLFVSTGIGAPDNAPLISREECWAGYCGADLGGFVQGTTRLAVAYGTRGAKTVKPDGTGRGYLVTAKTQTHQVAVSFLTHASKPIKRVVLTTATGTDHVNVRLAPYGTNRLLLSYETYKGATCTAGTCTGTFSGTHLRLIDYNGAYLTSDLTLPVRIPGDIAVMPDGDLVWGYVFAAPNRKGPVGATSPTTTTLKIARLNYVAD